MVNFTEKLDANVRAEWASHYIDYRALKKAMKKASSQPGSTDVKRARANSSGLREPLLPGAQGAAAEQGTPLAANIFLAALHAERDKVQGFYEAELQRLTEQEHVLQAQMGRASELSSAERSSVTLAAIDLFRMLQVRRAGMQGGGAGSG
jgi:SPX domain protein involved in polyphosphate accumulation|eukprot:3372235-Prymnesium_polylepis.1